MRQVLSSDRGSGLYGKRQPMIEPVFANTKFNRKLSRFHRRGRAAVRTEWRLITATHNLLKLHNHQLAAASAYGDPPAKPGPLPRKQLDDARYAGCRPRIRGKGRAGVASA